MVSRTTVGTRLRLWNIGDNGRWRNIIARAVSLKCWLIHIAIGWESLEQCRADVRLTLLYKMVSAQKLFSTVLCRTRHTYKDNRIPLFKIIINPVSNAFSPSPKQFSVLSMLSGQLQTISPLGDYSNFSFALFSRIITSAILLKQLVTSGSVNIAIVTSSSVTNY